ncbi:MAG: hypothetical protein HGA45_32295 [Chloroflexales bacterium]|nr:hypothetical protein [Chloroflexales bacterium]
MNQTVSVTTAPQVSDLVLDPFVYSEALRGPVLRGSLPDDEAERLSTVLPVAIAQLDAIGDAYGAIALATLYEQIECLQTLA